MSETVAAREAESRLSELIDRAANGEEIVITRAGAAVARLVSAHTADQADETGDVFDMPGIIASLAKLRGEIAKDHPGLALSTLLSWRDEGRH